MAWPAETWDESTPEDQGMESSRLAALLADVAATPGIDSVTIVRNGYLVLDTTVYPFPPDRAHIIHSCTKSIVSTLVGMAVDDGLLDGTDVPVVEVLPDAAPLDVSDLKAAMTVEDLLTMRSGLDCRDSYRYDWQGLGEMRASDDWAAHMLALPMSEEPGTRFEYCNGASYLLSAIVTEVTGAPALDFARDRLFGPLGITDVTWPANAEGVNHGWGSMYLQPRGMARFGLLVLRDGEWDGQQIVSAEWLAAATAPIASAGTLSSGYGYQWWVDDNGYVMALGFGGQHIIIDRENGIVAVFTAGTGIGFDQPERLFLRHVRTAVVSDEPLPADPDAHAALLDAAAALEDGPEAAAQARSPLEEAVDGVTYTLSDNPGGFTWFRLDFADDGLVMSLEDIDGPIEVTAAFDGRFHESPAWGRPWSWRPVWADDDTLVVSFQIIGGVARGEFRFSFEGDLVRFRYHEDVLATDVRAEGTPQG